MSKIDLIKQRLQQLQTKNSGNSSQVDYSTIFWKPKMGTQVVRIVPRKENRDFPFVEVSFHKYDVFKKSVYCLESFGEQDPVKQFIKELYAEGSTDAKDLAKKIAPRTKYFAQVVVRGEEEQGVRLWEFNKTTYEKLLSIMANEDFGDITDITEGTDLTIEGYKDKVKVGKKEVEYIAVNVTPKRKMSPLASNSTQAQSYLEEQKDILSVYKKFSYDEIKEMLKNYLQPKEEGTPSEEQEEVVNVKANEIKEEDDDASDAPFPIPAKKTTADKFNDLFDEE
jgi:hypothetical protein